LPARRPESILEPLSLIDTEGEVIAGLWAEDSLEPFSLRPVVWDPLFSHPDVGPLMLPILLHREV
jgi:hypothetical protein